MARPTARALRDGALSVLQEMVTIAAYGTFLVLCLGVAAWIFVGSPSLAEMIFGPPVCQELVRQALSQPACQEALPPIPSLPQR